MGTYPTKADYVDAVEIDETLDRLADAETVETTAASLRANGFSVAVVEDRETALEAVVERIPSGATVNLGHSTTLEEIGFVDYLAEGDHD